MTAALDVIHVADLRAPLALTQRSRLGPLALARPGQPQLTMPMLAFVVRHPEAGPLLVDTGLHPDALGSITADYGRFPGLFFASARPAGPDFAAQLRERGVDPSAVERVVMTHLHADHTSAMRLLDRARFLVDHREWRAANAPRAAAAGYAPRHLPPADRVEPLDLERDGEAFGPFSATLDLLGDGTVRLVATPGHSPGHLSLLLRTGEREVFLLGDAVYTLDNLRTGALPWRCHDDDRYRQSVAELQAFAREHPDVVLVPTHDPEAYKPLLATAAVS